MGEGAHTDDRSFASFFWPRQGVNYSKLMDIHSKLVRCVVRMVMVRAGANAMPQASETSPAPKKPKAKRKVDGGDGSAKKKPKVELE